MPRFISDSQMMQLETQGIAKAPESKQKRFISDDEMASFERYGKAEAPSKPGALQAFTEQSANITLLGNLPQLQAAMGRFMPDPNAELDEKLRAQGFVIKQPEQSYVGLRDENIKRLAQQEKDFPTASRLGKAAGIIQGGLLTVGAGGALGIAPAATRVGRVAQSVGGGATAGALANPGDVEGKLSGLQLEERLNNALLGGALSGALQGGAEVLGPLAKKAGEGLKKLAREKAIKTLGPTTKAFEKIKLSKQEGELGGTLLEEGAIPVFGTTKRVAKRVVSLKEKAGVRLGKLLDQAGDEKLINSTEIAVDLLNSPKVAQLRKTPGMESLASRVDQFADTIASNGQMSLREAQALRQAVDKSINFSKQVPELKGIQSVLYDVRTMIRDRMNRAISSLDVSKGLPKDQLLKLNKAYGNLAEAKSIVDKRIARNAANRAISLTDTIAAGAGIAGGDTPAEKAGLALLLAAINKSGRAVGSAVQARTADVASKALLRASPMIVAMARQSPISAQVLLNRISQDTPFKEKKSDPILEDEKIMGFFRANPDLIDAIKDPKLKAAIQAKLGRTPASR